MKKGKKRILGLVCLALVVATTIFAALLPSPETSAIVEAETEASL